MNERLIAVLREAVDTRSRPNIDDIDAQNILFDFERLQAELAQVKAERDMWKETDLRDAGRVDELAVRCGIAEGELATLRWKYEMLTNKIADGYLVGEVLSDRSASLYDTLPIGTKLYTTPQPCPKCAKALEALRNLSMYVAFNGDDWVQRTASEASAELEK